MFEDVTPEQIKTDILGRIVSNLDTREGSFTNDMVSAVSYRIWETLQSLDAIVPIAYIDETSGEYIDKRCSEYGITRKAGVKAAVTLSITGTAGTVVPDGKVFITPAGLEFVTDAAVTLADTATACAATASDVGASYNVAAGTITGQLESLIGVTAVTNETAATGGTDPETDSALCLRFYDFLQNPATSGNAAHYKQWALAVSGVGAAKVTPLWAGAGTVKVLIVGDTLRPVDDTIVAACAANIEEKRPIGATVTVKSASALSVSVAGSVTIDTYTTKTAVQTAFVSALSAYLKSISFVKYTLVYNRIAALLLDIDGVQDCSGLTINGGTANITIGADEVPVLGTVSIT